MCVFFIPAAVGTALSIGAQLGIRQAPRFAKGSYKRYFKYYGKQWGGRSAQGFPFGLGYASGTYTGFPGNYREQKTKYTKYRTSTMAYGYRPRYNRYSRYQPYRRRRYYRPRYPRRY